MILRGRNALEKRAIVAQGVIAFVVLIGIIVAIFLLVLLRVLWTRRKANLQAPNASKREKGLRGFFQLFKPIQQPYQSARSSAGNGRSNVSTRHSSDFNHELQDETRQNNRMSNNRHSVRSIVTLPPYHVAPLPSERLIAREGERAGVDSVVEYPESDGELEERREEEMQTLYNIRAARRREQEERAARREQRRTAVLQGDWARVRAIDEENQARSRSRDNSAALTDANRNNSSTGLEIGDDPSQADSGLLIAQLQSLREHNSASRRVSSVSYAELGVARHDGSRIRGDSVDSDHRPLLDSAASMGGGDRSRASSVASGRAPSRSRATLQINSDARPSTATSFVSQDDGGFLTPQSTSGDIPPEPPSYDDDLSVHGGEAPAYESPVVTRAPEFPAATHTSDAGRTERAISPTVLIHEPRDQQSETRTTSASPEPPQLHLNTSVNPPPPAIQVVQATPIIPYPTSPIPER